MMILSTIRCCTSASCFPFSQHCLLSRTMDGSALAEIRKVAWPPDCTLILACSDSTHVDTTSMRHAHCRLRQAVPPKLHSLRDRILKPNTRLDVETSSVLADPWPACSRTFSRNRECHYKAKKSEQQFFESFVSGL